MMNWINKIWNDPVWSKVISAAFLAIIAYIYQKCRNKITVYIKDGYIIIQNNGKQDICNITIKVTDSYICDLSAIFTHANYGKEYKHDTLDTINEICAKKYSIKAGEELRLSLFPDGEVYFYRGLLDDNEECREYSRYTDAVALYFEKSKITKCFNTITIKR